MRYYMYVGGLTPTLSSSAAVARSLGFLTRHLETKSVNSGDHLSGSRNEGGGLVGIINIALIGWMSPYGGLPSAISRAVIPERTTA